MSEHSLTLTRAEKSVSAGDGSARRIIIDCGVPITMNMMREFGAIAQSIGGIENVYPGEMRGLITLLIESGRSTFKIADSFIVAVHERLDEMSEEERYLLLRDTSSSAFAVSSSTAWPFDTEL